jgi:hypothetical protein
MTDQLRLGTLGDDILAGPSVLLGDGIVQGDGMSVPIPFATGATIPIPFASGATIPIPLYGMGGDLMILSGGISIPTP